MTTFEDRPKSTTTRSAASERAAGVRAVHRALAAEHADVPAGLVLAVAVRCARDLHLAGCDDHRFVEGLERLVRAVLLARETQRGPHR